MRKNIGLDECIVLGQLAKMKKMKNKMVKILIILMAYIKKMGQKSSFFKLFLHYSMPHIHYLNQTIRFS